MNRIQSRFLCAVLSAGFACFGQRAPIEQQLTFTPYHANGIYELGETVGWTVAPGPAKPTYSYKWTIRRNNAVVLNQGKLDLTSGKDKIEIVGDQPEMIYVAIEPYAALDTPASAPTYIGGNTGRNNGLYAVGAAVAPEKIGLSTPRPDDFDAFWEGKLSAQAKVPINPVLTPVATDVAGVELNLFVLDALGSHTHGYVAKPAREGKFPALIQLQYAGVYALNPHAAAQHAAEGWLAINVDSHDKLPSDASGNIPKNYQSIGNTDREKSYFLDMYLRDSRALDYLLTRPDWDGKTIVLTGGSMGGQQSLVLAGLRPEKITAALVCVPAGADTNADLHGRKAGYPNWPSDNAEAMKTALYFDTVNFAPHIHATVLAGMGFIDTTSPPAGIWTMLNQIPGPKEPLPMIESEHDNLTPQKGRACPARTREVLDLLVKGGEFKPSGLQPSPAQDGIAHQLFVGTCYQPVDRTPEQIDGDIAIMKRAGFNVVRMGDLSWDSFEPEPGKFTFEWFDSIMDKMQASGIRVIVDIPGLPAPIWLHRAHPGVDIVNENGARVPPAERYMDNMSDPDYVREAALLAEALTKRYAHHPAVIAIGYDNEIGNGFMSDSEADRQRFIAWLKAKYGTISTLNKDWATQRWSRRLNSFDDVDLPLANGPGPAERFLDLHRYWSDVTVQRLRELEEIRRRNMPAIPSISNLWDTASRRGFDYLSTYKSYVSYGAEGFYPGEPVSGALGALMTKGDLETPIWFNEFTAGGGGYYGTPGRSRMYAYEALLIGAQAVLAWTFNSHTGGEEQALFGLLNHDGTPSWKVDEFARMAAEFKKLEKFGFPRYPRPEVAIAYSFDSFIASHPNGPSSTTRQYFKTPYTKQVEEAFRPLFRANADVAIINIGNHDLSRYKLVVVPADYLMDEPGAKALRAYVSGGGTVLMTALSAKVDEHAQWFDTPLPGRLSDVFGLKTNEFYDVESDLTYELDGASIESGARWYEVLEPSTATVLSRFTNIPGHSPALTINKFGKGNALYLATESKASAIGPVLTSIFKMVGIQPGPRTPEGVYARVVDGRTLYVNMTQAKQKIPIDGRHKGILTDRVYDGTVILEPQDADLIQ